MSQCLKHIVEAEASNPLIVKLKFLQGPDGDSSGFVNVRKRVEFAELPVRIVVVLGGNNAESNHECVQKFLSALMAILVRATYSPKVESLFCVEKWTIGRVEISAVIQAQKTLFAPHLSIELQKMGGRNGNFASLFRSYEHND
jgi:hypothetical protein